MDVITKVPISMGKGNVIPIGTKKPKEFFGNSAAYLISRGTLAIVPPEPPKVDPPKDDEKADAVTPKVDEPKGKGR